MTFKKDLELGEYYEYKLIDILKPVNYLKKEGLFKDYDLEIIDKNEMKIYYEVKCDKYTNTTNNICIEYECNKKPSGITTTTADYYAYFVIDKYNDKKYYNLYIIPVIDIMELIKNKKYHCIKNLGDNLASKCYLFNKNIFNEFKYKL